ncbi:TIGR03943 family protein [Fusibacter sp. 3D3]|uniref:TIGR03943 family putative permease subunit n=1 Tax=Fusibacter sp. 3D3 TaxID=1048380 RepID=UPI00085388E4|nr:TIGR03943 family protein [Fusibacter sp. 3D3]GAU76673.1 protein of unknown function DUF1980 [Fusibacter sp. 3D3]
MYIKGSKRINIEAVLKIAVLLGFAVLFSKMIASGEIHYYVHPRMVPYVKGGIGAMVVIALFTTKDVFRMKQHINIAPYLFFLMPLVTGFVLPVKVMDATSFATGIQLSRKAPAQVAIQPSKAPAIEVALDSNQTFKEVTETPSTPSTPLSLDKQSFSKTSQTVAALEGQVFLKTVDKLSLDLDAVVGQEIELAGFIYLEEGFESNQFVVGRYVVTCCAADAEMYGILCVDDSELDHKANSWVRVKGIVEQTTYRRSYDDQEIEMAQIRVKEIEIIAPPKEPYIYYN